MSVVLPFFLWVAHQFGHAPATPKHLLSDTFQAWKLIVFAMQNLVLFCCWYIGDEFILTILVNVAFRFNVLDMMRQSYKDGDTMYAVTGLPLLCWPIFDAQFHPVFLFEVTNTPSSFGVLYMIWLVGGILKMSKGAAMLVLHPLLPLMFPANLWFAARTFTGVNVISILFFKPTFYQLVDTSKHATKIQAFSKVYDSVYPLLFTGMMIHLLLSYLGGR
jgi:hypothetical protein